LTDPISSIQNKSAHPGYNISIRKMTNRQF